MWYARIERFYKQKLWTIGQVRDAVIYEKITEDEFKQITGEDYQ